MKLHKYIIILLIIILCCLCVYTCRKEWYDTREGVFATIITEKPGQDSEGFESGVVLSATHYEGQLDESNGWVVNQVDEGILSDNDLDFLKRFYNDEEGRKELTIYTARPDLYPDTTVLNKFVSGFSFSDTDASISEAEQRATDAEAQVQTIQQELEQVKLSIAPLQQGNEEREARISELESQLADARARAEQARTDADVKRQESAQIDASTNFISNLMGDVYKPAGAGSGDAPEKTDITPNLSSYELLQFWHSAGDLNQWYQLHIPAVWHVLNFDGHGNMVRALDKNVSRDPYKNPGWLIDREKKAKILAHEYYKWAWGVDLAHGNTSAYPLDYLMKDLGLSNEDTVTIPDDSPWGANLLSGANNPLSLRGETYTLGALLETPADYDESVLFAVRYELQKQYDTKRGVTRGLPLDTMLEELGISTSSMIFDRPMEDYIKTNLNADGAYMFLPGRVARDGFTLLPSTDYMWWLVNVTGNGSAVRRSSVDEMKRQRDTGLSYPPGNPGGNTRSITWIYQHKLILTKFYVLDVYKKRFPATETDSASVERDYEKIALPEATPDTEDIYAEYR